MAVILSSVRVYAEERVASDVRADLYVSSSQINVASGPVIGQEAYDIVRNTPGIAETMRWGFGSAWLDGTKYRVGAVDSTVADSMYFFDATPSLESLGDGVFIGPALQNLGYQPGDVVVLDGPIADRTLTIAGEYDGAIGDALLVDWATAEALFGNVETISVLATIEPTGDPAEIRANLDDALANFPLIKTYDQDDLLGMADGLLTLVLILVSALLSGALIIALLGIANTLLLSVTERTREIGLLRAIGLSRRAVRRMIRLESVVIAGFGAAMGVVLGTALGAAVIVALKDLGLTTPSIPWRLLGVYFLVAILAGLLAAALPARRAARLDILQSITTE